MKPPSRHRIAPVRFSQIKRPEPRSRVHLRCHQLQQRRFLLALKQMKGFNSELDFLELQKKVPKWSLLQIENMVKFLKRCVVQRVYFQVQNQKHEEVKTKEPMEVWAGLAQKVTGVYEETISSAFSQMLVIASTEPSVLLHSDPPCAIKSPGTLTSGFRTIPMRPMPKSYRGSPTLGLPEHYPKTTQSHGKNAVSNSSVQTTTVTCPSATAEDGGSEMQKKTEAGKFTAVPSTTSKSLLSQTVLKPTPPSFMSTAVPLITSDTAQPEKQTECVQSVQSGQYRPMGMKNVVDFERIYKFMSNIVLQKHAEPLTAMESAVILDLLMSLTEELPLLDCKELQHHLLQIHSRLNTPAAKFSTDQEPEVANSSSTSGTEQMYTNADQHAKEVSLQTLIVQSTGKEGVQNEAASPQVNSIESPLAAGNLVGKSSAINLSQEKVIGPLLAFVH